MRNIAFSASLSVKYIGIPLHGTRTNGATSEDEKYFKQAKRTARPK